MRRRGHSLTRHSISDGGRTRVKESERENCIESEINENTPLKETNKTPESPSTMTSCFGYRKELRKYEDLDEDKLLASLSSEELQELESELADLDPDHNVPIGLRQKDQTAKTPTGSFDRDSLLKYREDENKKLLQDDKAESNCGQAASAEDGRPDKSRGERETASLSAKTQDHKKKTGQRGQKAQSVSNKSKEEEEKKDEGKNQAELRSKEPQRKRNDPSKASKNKSKKDKSRTESTTDQKVSVTSDRLSGNPIAIDKALEQILQNEPSMIEVNLNNIEDISQETLLHFAEALCTNTHVSVFSLANTHADDRVAFAISKMLCQNHSVRNLNIESNFVSGRGILALLAALQHNRTLAELRFHNQRHICGGKVEMEMVKLLRENTTLIKLGYQFDLPGPRMTATSILTRNQDQQRQRRLQEKQEQSQPAPSVSQKIRPAKKPTRASKTAEGQDKNLPPSGSSLAPPTRKIAEMFEQHEVSNTAKLQSNQWKPKSKRLKNGANEKESAVILIDLKPSQQKRRDEPSAPPPLQRSSRDDLMAEIRGSSIRSLKRVDPSLS